MIIKRIQLLLLAIVLINMPILAQYRIIGTVRDSATRESLIGATIVLNGTTEGTITDLNGRFRLNVKAAGKNKIQARFIGYKTSDFEVETPQKDTSFVIYLATEGNLLDEIVISSVRTNSTIENIPTKIEVLGLEEVNEENGIKPGNIMSLLSDVAGIQMQQVSASSGNTYARIQGLNGRYTQILRDGLPLFGGMSGGLSIMQIPPLDLKQIEIIKGCGSTLYGADAIGGIINLISKNPTDKQELSLTLNQTTLNESNLNLYAAKKYKQYGYTLFAGATIQQAGDVDNDGLSDVPLVNSFIVHPRLIFYLNRKSTLSVNYSGTFDQRKGGVMSYFMEPSIDTLYHVANTSQRHSADINWIYKISNRSSITAKLSNSFLNQSLETRIYQFRATQDIYYSEVSYNHSSDFSEWVAGANLNGDIFTKKNEGFAGIDNYNYSTAGIFVQNKLNITRKLSVEGGYREDYHSEYGLFHLPRLSLMVKFNDHITGRINSGLGYKIPVQFSYIDPETDLHNMVKTRLEPERSVGLNADINWERYFSDDISIVFNQAIFYTSIQHPVVDSSNVAGQLMLSNATKPLTTRGLQTYMRLGYKKLEFYLGYVYTDVLQEFDADHQTPYAIPRHQFSTTAFYDLSEHFVFGLESSYFAGQLDQNYDKTKNYLMIAAMLRYSFRNFDFVLNGENLLDFRQSNYERIYDGTINNPVFHQLWAPIDGRVINISVKWALKQHTD